MKDLDFDELDQAVSSVLGTDAKPATPPVDPAVPAAPSTPASTSPTETQEATPSTAVPVTSTPAAPKPTPAASPAVRRRGQFLDMVHPASKMSSSPSLSAPSAAKKKLAPVSSNVTPSPLPTTPVTSPAPASAEVPEPSTQSSIDTMWPDPLDMMSDTPDKPELPAESETPDTAPAEVPAAESATTPFVTDPKVSKRPLNALAANEALQESDKTEHTPESAPAVTTPAASSAALELPNLDATPKDAQQKPPIIDTTPPELQPDVVSVESDAGNELVDSPTVEEAPAPMPNPAAETPVAPHESGLTQSISQQYQTPAEMPDQAPHPIFDTQEYHQPLLPATAKKNRSWIVVLVIVLLLVVGAALGYFAFMAGL